MSSPKISTLKKREAFVEMMAYAHVLADLTSCRLNPPPTRKQLAPAVRRWAGAAKRLLSTP
ncbi:hypothetical protein AGMMS50256_30680 [Betaproteobacteria bacterium]|nr:hypothetical protein AGMMS50256_30680 [Betaproteobacteria bacterium]